jgi:hypothetical protein
LFKRPVGRVDEIRLSWRTDIRAEENPRVRAFHEICSALEVAINAQKSELVTAQGDEETVARRLAGRQDPDHFQPTRESAPLLAHALPPAAARRHEDERRQ